ncbi:hypothetical protein TNCV_1656271 [Trichonephila clavipes]|nr:hypothetical protein TNCV_1656271 [Trichonephila clavipes]
MSPYSATRVLWAMDLLILNHGQVMRTTPELAPPSPNFHSISTGGRFNSESLTRISSSTRRDFSGTRLDLMTCGP